MDIIDNNFCDDTYKRDNICSICGKKMAFVDSPFGAIPSLALMERFYEDFKEKFIKEKTELKNFAQSEVLETSKEKLKEVDLFLEEQRKSFISLKNEFKSTMNSFNNNIEESKQSFARIIEEKSNSFEDMESSLKYLINRVYIGFSEYLTFFSRIINKTVSLISDFKLAKNDYIKVFEPKLTKMITSFDDFKKILPQTEIYLAGPQQTKIEEFFKVNKNLSSKKTLKEMKLQFQQAWNKISFFPEKNQLENESI